MEKMPPWYILGSPVSRCDLAKNLGFLPFLSIVIHIFHHQPECYYHVCQCPGQEQGSAGLNIAIRSLQIVQGRVCTTCIRYKTLYVGLSAGCLSVPKYYINEIAPLVSHPFQNNIRTGWEDKNISRNSYLYMYVKNTRESNLNNKFPNTLNYGHSKATCKFILPTVVNAAPRLLNGLPLEI